jgi:hypothetical protein
VRPEDPHGLFTPFFAVFRGFFPFAADATFHVRATSLRLGDAE